MPASWTSGNQNGVDLHIDPSRRSATDLAAALRAAVRDGRLITGAALPSTRALGADLGIARGTVTAAYSQLAAEGYLVVRHGAPTRVADVQQLPQARLAPATHTSSGPTAGWTFTHNLLPGLPDVSAFPRDAWAASIRRALATAPHDTFGYPDRLGHPALRRALAAYLGRARGVLADPEHVVVGPGFTAMIALWARAVRSYGVTAVTVEDPFLPHLHRAVETAGIDVTGAPVDHDGVQVAAITTRGAVLTPAHQYPLGHTLAPTRRAALARRAAAHDMQILEDDYDGEFRFDRRPVGALQALAPDHITYGGTASKALAPGLRLAWMVVPQRLLPHIRDHAAAAGMPVPVIDQLALADILDTGAYDKQVRRMRGRYRARRDALVEAVAPLGYDPDGIAAGLHLLLPLGAGGEPAAAAAAKRHRLGIDLLGRHSITLPHPDGLLVGFGAPTDHAYPAALDALVAVLRAL
ncbi:MocR-like pyridoxine biosynthesis transcription factor PdxR [Pseudonocardia sp. TRM90224]|uniref:MocR-like pyridoxine biosynthesis transcription factor PdxR n=1 Tax=Pseudonocardia sp. TRM90224 TaxID=2812678 RepID=UPI001E4F4719|nr:PLP-dependent aminotransferase family protein [Pseudonocardia sp. TRM90224]